jgi:gamma-glutamyltranspeptidase/glutathione hydrolase
MEFGSDSFGLVWDGKQLHGLNASGRAPADWTPLRYAGRDSMPITGWDSVTVRVRSLVGLHYRSASVASHSVTSSSLPSTMQNADISCRRLWRGNGRRSYRAFSGTRFRGSIHCRAAVLPVPVS